MPYCQPANIWHPDEEMADGTLRWCTAHRQWHHATQRCEYQLNDLSAAAFTASATEPEVCDECGAHHYGEACPHAVAPCGRCGENHAPVDECYYCDNCDEWVNEDHDCPYYECQYCGDVVSYDDAHNCQSGGCDCVSPQLAFAIRNDGADPLANDVRASFTLPAGTISQAGLKELGRYIRYQGYRNLSYDLDKLGDQWQTRNGNYAKRLSRLAYQDHGEKLSPEVMSQVGVIAREHSNAVDVRIEVTRDLNLSASDFYHDDSCYWGSYSESRCALKTNGAFGLRSFNQYGDVSGRAWVMPLRKDEAGSLVPTFNTMTPDAFVVFNGYGDLGGYAAARIMSHMAGWTYRKIGFDCSPMYINAGGYLVAPEEIAEPYTDGRLNMSVRQHASIYESEMSYA